MFNTLIAALLPESSRWNTMVTLKLPTETQKGFTKLVDDLFKLFYQDSVYSTWIVYVVTSALISPPLTWKGRVRLELDLTLVDRPSGNINEIIPIVLDGYNAPVTAGNFLDLVQRGFYEGMSIQRADGFVV